MKRVLVVDDDANVLFAVSELLDAAGFEVTAHNSPVQALEELRLERYYALMTDWVMPQVDGLTLVRESLARGSAERHVVLSGYDAPEDAQSMSVVWLRKPVDFGRIVAALAP